MVMIQKFLIVIQFCCPNSLEIQKPIQQKIHKRIYLKKKSHCWSTNLNANNIHHSTSNAKCDNWAMKVKTNLNECDFESAWLNQPVEGQNKIMYKSLKEE